MSRENFSQTGALVTYDGFLAGAVAPLPPRAQTFMDTLRPIAVDEALYFDLVRAALVMRQMSTVQLAGTSEQRQRATTYFAAAMKFQDQAIDNYGASEDRFSAVAVDIAAGSMIEYLLPQ